MADFEFDLDLVSALEAPRRCPRCSAETLVPASRDGAVVFRCRDCGQTWEYESGLLVTVPDPAPDGEVEM